MLRFPRFSAVVLFLCAFPLFIRAQAVLPDASELRNYVGLISQTFHPEITALLEKIREEHKDDEDYVKRLDRSLKGPTGSGFLINLNLGNYEETETYVLTNYHVIASAGELSITFIQQNGERTVYNGLRVIAADEEQDLALLALPEGSFQGLPGLHFLDSPVREGEDVYTAGFPALAYESIWQFGRGMISNADVMVPSVSDEEELVGPFIQHTAPADPGNSGGPLLVHDPWAPTGFAVAGINTLSARRRQAANYAVPASRARAYVEKALSAEEEAAVSRKKLDDRLASFLEIFKEKEKPRQNKTADYLSLSCIGENAFYAYYEAINQKLYYNIDSAIINNPVGVLANSVAWVMEIPLSSKKITPEIIGVSEEPDGSYTVVFAFEKKEIASRWVLIYGKWRIDSFGEADGDKSRIAKLEERNRLEKDIRDEDYGFHFEGGYVHIVDRGPAVFASLGFEDGGFRLYFADEDFWQFEAYGEFRYPWRFSVFSLSLNVNFGMGFKKVPRINFNDWGLRVGLSPQLGLQLISSLIPGLYISAAYQFNWYFKDSADTGSDTHLFIFSAGYRFKEKKRN